MAPDTPSESNPDKESRSTSLDPAPCNGGRVEQQIWAFRRYYGIGPAGQSVEEWTQQEIADTLGVSRQTVDRWMNRETTAPGIVGSLTRRQRLLLYGMIVSGRSEGVEEYLTLLSLEEELIERREGTRVKSSGFESRESDSRNSTGGDRGISSEHSTSSGSDPHPFAGLDEDFSW